MISWRRQRQALSQFMQTVPFRLDLDAPAHALAAGEKQKVEIVKQLYLRHRLLILDEPTSVLTPAEADDILDLLRAAVEPRPAGSANQGGSDVQ